MSFVVWHPVRLTTDATVKFVHHGDIKLSLWRIT